MCWTSIKWRSVLDQLGDEAPEVVTLLGQLLDEGQRAAVSRSMIRSHNLKSASSSTVPRSCKTDCTVIVPSVAAASWSSVEVASRNEPREERATRDKRLLRRVDLSRPGHPRQHGEDVLGAAAEDERLTARPRTVGQYLREMVVQKMKTRCAAAPRSASGRAFRAP